MELAEFEALVGPRSTHREYQPKRKFLEQAQSIGNAQREQKEAGELDEDGLVEHVKDMFHLCLAYQIGVGEQGVDPSEGILAYNGFLGVAKTSEGAKACDIVKNRQSDLILAQCKPTNMPQDKDEGKLRDYINLLFPGD